MPGLAGSATRHNVPDAFGEAALLLAESTLHVLVEAGVLTPDQALDAVRTAVCVKAEAAEGEKGPDTTDGQSLRMLRRIEGSMACIDERLIQGGAA